MFNSPTRPGFSKLPRPMSNRYKEKMSAPNNAYYVLTQAHAGLPNSVLVTNLTDGAITNLKADHITEKTVDHNIVFDNDIEISGNRIRIDNDIIGGTDNAFRFSTLDTKFEFLTYEGGDTRVTILGNAAFENDYDYDLGSAIHKWKDLYLSGDISVDGSVDGVDIAGQAIFVTDAYNHISADGTSHANVVLNDTHRASNGTDHAYINQDVTTTGEPTFDKLTVNAWGDFGTTLKVGTSIGIGVTAPINGWDLFAMEKERANNYCGMYLKNTSADGISRFNLGMTMAETTFGILTQFDKEDGRALILNRTPTTGVLDLSTTGGTGISILNDAGIKMANLKSGANQGAAGAAADELWIDTADNSIKIGV